MALIEPGDIEPFADIDPDKLAAMIADSVAMAVLVAPCLGDENQLTAEQKAAAKAVLRGAILRWNDSGSGAYQQQTAGPFSVSMDTRQQRRSMFWPSEIEQLQDICGGSVTGDAFSVDTAPGHGGIVHSDVCALRFGADYCSCGAILTMAGPLWETPPYPYRVT